MKLPESQLPGEDMARVRIKREQEWEETGKKGEIRGGGKREQMFTCLVRISHLVFSICFLKTLMFPFGNAVVSVAL